MAVNTQPIHNAVGIVLAAGHGSRMRSRTPKPLHRVAGKELIRFPVELLAGCGVQQIMVVASPDNFDAIYSVLGDGVTYAVQPNPDGTADALACALAQLPTVPPLVLVMAGDTPLVRLESVQKLAAEHASVPDRRMTILSAADAFSEDLGRIERASVTSDGRVGSVSAIVEAADRVRQTYGPAEVNTGVYCFSGDWVAEHIGNVAPAPSGERYLTALVATGADRGEDVAAMPIALADESMGVNTREQLAGVEAALRDRINCHWMANGVTIVDLATTYIDAGVAIGMDTVVLPNTMLTGNTNIGEECQIGPNSVIQDTHIGDRCRVLASFLESAHVASDVSIGPYCHLRPDTSIANGVHLGNFVEVKNSHVGANTAAGHFCYLGDADIGAGANIGAGAVTCNFDGVEKHRTAVGDGAFIGSDTMLVAPVSVGRGAATGAGSVVTKDVPAGRRAVGVPARLIPNVE